MKARRRRLASSMVRATGIPLLILGVVLWLTVSTLIVQTQVASWLEERSVELLADRHLPIQSPMQVLDVAPLADWVLSAGEVHQSVRMGSEEIDLLVPEHLVTRTRLLLRALLFLLLTVVSGTLLVLWIWGRRAVVYPVEQLAEKVRSLAGHETADPLLVSSVLRLSGNRNDEIADLAQAFTDVYQALAAREQDLEQSVTELRQALSDVKTARSRLIQSEQFAALGQFASGLAHELGSPLAAAMQQMFLLQEVPVADIDKQESLQWIAESLTRMDGILKALQGVYRGGALQLEELDFSQILSVAVGRARHLLPTTVRLKLESSAPQTVLGNSYLVEQSLFNLVRNAIESAPAGSTVSISLTQVGTSARVEVRDQGGGVLLDEDGLPLYNPAKGGMGVGVRIVDRAIRLMGGELRYLMNTKGTTVQLALPISCGRQLK